MLQPSLKRPRSPSSYFSSLDHTTPQDQAHPEGRPLIRNLRALEAELCELDRLGLQSESPAEQLEGGRLIRLNTLHNQEQEHLQNSVWVDRYDARLLLSPPPSRSTDSTLEPQITSPPAQSPTGYSDLPSDHEEMFYFQPEERVEIAQKKLRRRRDDERSVRIKLREEEDRLREEELRLSKIPPTDQITLMQRTLEALKGSPSPSLLEIRILTNHGTDPRFASFLRRDGKWRAYWEAMKAAPAEPAPAITTQPLVDPPPPSAAGGLVDYGDSSDEDGAGKDAKTAPVEGEEVDTAPDQPPADDRSSGKTSSGGEEEADKKDMPGPSDGAGPPVHDQNPAETPAPASEHAGLHSDPTTMEDPIPAPGTLVDPGERLQRQQRAKLWAEKRKQKATILRPDPPLPTPSP
ncbi:hypothetical protein PtA15_5A77 [Puccinia triticina]|uniref:SURP motif domain-containing protein n=1 Tax=Puccinia triticina TaxID=208348 RepID=A0ABY7CP06_9BASI|nr:uncharacterized protein PtA15_5A77 [Puccinia triticina]WAQ84507.1 hypothetical protein PtA15_5A77 [Puccinia triticina]